MLHWHGDQFEIPNGLKSLASTSLCPHQAFADGDNALGLQFHLEADSQRIEHRTMARGACRRLEHAGVDPSKLRAQAQADGTRLKTAAEAVFGAWLDQVEHYAEGTN